MFDILLWVFLKNVSNLDLILIKGGKHMFLE